jgi:hypothetical protein
MRTGFSLSPGGLLLPYHLGCLDSLRYNGYLDNSTPIAGSSAGAIAVATEGCGISSSLVMDATIKISEVCKQQGSARGRLLPLLRTELEQTIQEEQHLRLQERTGPTLVAYKEVFPRNQAVLQADFEDSNDLIQAVCNSSMFPFFATNFPLSLDVSKRIPRLVVDGFFTVPRNRFGCPDFEAASIEVDRTVAISVFPRESIGATAFAESDCICPELKGDPSEQMSALVRLATAPSSAEELQQLYECGWMDAEKWTYNCGEDSEEKALN